MGCGPKVIGPLLEAMTIKCIQRLGEDEKIHPKKAAGRFLGPEETEVFGRCFFGVVEQFNQLSTTEELSGYECEEERCGSVVEDRHKNQQHTWTMDKFVLI